MLSIIGRHVRQVTIEHYLRLWEPPIAAKHMDEVEWGVYKIAPDGSRVRHSEGAQTVFGLTRARRVLKELGAEWCILDREGNPPPQE